MVEELRALRLVESSASRYFLQSRCAQRHERALKSIKHAAYVTCVLCMQILGHFMTKQCKKIKINKKQMSFTPLLNYLEHESKI